jgi:hypothetical protein
MSIANSTQGNDAAEDLCWRKIKKYPVEISPPAAWPTSIIAVTCTTVYSKWPRYLKLSMLFASYYLSLTNSSPCARISLVAKNQRNCTSKK